jgi:hypothetical protein
MEWPGGDTSGGITIRPYMGVRVLTRLKRWGWVLMNNLSLWDGRVSTEDMSGAWWGRLEKRVRKSDRRDPTSLRHRERTDTPHYKAMTEREGDAAASAGRSLALAPWGSQRVRRRSPGFQGPKGHTDDNKMDEPHGTGPVRPRVSTASVLPV